MKKKKIVEIMLAIFVIVSIIFIGDSEYKSVGNLAITASIGITEVVVIKDRHWWWFLFFIPFIVASAYLVFSAKEISEMDFFLDTNKTSYGYFTLATGLLIGVFYGILLGKCLPIHR